MDVPKTYQRKTKKGKVITVKRKPKNVKKAFKAPAVKNPNRTITYQRKTKTGRVITITRRVGQRL